MLIRAFSRHTSAARAALVVLVVGLSPPVLSHAFLVFPETIALFIVCAVVWLAMAPASELNPRRVGLVVAAVGLMPWLHRKYSLLVFGLVFLLAVGHAQWLRRQRPGVIAMLAALAVLPQAALHAWTLHAWGNSGWPADGGHAAVRAGQRAHRRTRTAVRSRARARCVRAHVSAAAGVLGVVVEAVSSVARPDGHAVSADGRVFRVVCRVLAGRTVSRSARAARGGASSTGSRRACRSGLRLCRSSRFRRSSLGTVWRFPRTLWPKEQGTNDALASIPWIGRGVRTVTPIDSHWRLNRVGPVDPGRRRRGKRSACVECSPLRGGTSLTPGVWVTGRSTTSQTGRKYRPARSSVSDVQSRPWRARR